MSEQWRKIDGGAVRAWWKALNQQELNQGEYRFFFDRGPRARLRRMSKLSDIAQESAVWQLEPVLALQEQDGDALLLIAGVLAHAKDSEDKRSLAARFGYGAAAKDAKPVLSELRFQRLMRSTDPDDFLQQLRRALALGATEVDVAVLAQDLLAWDRERRHPGRSARSMKYRWAKDYYLRPVEKKLLQNEISEFETAPL